MECPCVVICLLAVFALPAAFIIMAAPWMAVRGPWVKYHVDVERVPDDAETNELYSQYPMLMFERQQHASEMCFTRVSTTLWKLVFHLNPRVECHYDRYDDDVGFRVRTHRYRCNVWYCLSDWTVLTNNRTRFSHHVSVKMGHQYNLLVADACWFVWWAPVFIIFGCSCCKEIKCCTVFGVIYAGVAFVARVVLSCMAMVEFYHYDALTDPPHGGYVQNSSVLQTFTTRSYGWGFISAWIVIGGNAIFTAAILGGLIYVCVSGCEKVNDEWDGARQKVSSIRRKSSRGRDHVDAAVVVELNSAPPPETDLDTATDVYLPPPTYDEVAGQAADDATQEPDSAEPEAGSHSTDD